MLKELLSDSGISEILHLVSLVKEEIKDAEKYANMAAKYRGSDQSLCASFAKLANEEISHAETLQGMAADKLSVYDRSGTEVPEKLLFVWDYEKDRSVEDVAAVRMMLSACR